MLKQFKQVDDMLHEIINFISYALHFCLTTGAEDSKKIIHQS